MYDRRKSLNCGNIRAFVVLNKSEFYRFHLVYKCEKGFAPCAWITGSAGWLYRAVTEYILGIQADFDGLKISPCLPTKWDEVQVEREFRGASYLISYRRGQNKGLFVDGKKLTGNKIPLFPVTTIHKIEYIF